MGMREKRFDPRKPSVKEISQSLSFSQILGLELKSARSTAPLPKNACQTFDHKTCRLCASIHLDYVTELFAKQKAFEHFWKLQRLGGQLLPLIASPKGRKYRTVSKRRAFKDKFRRTCLGMTDVTEEGIRSLNVIHCPIEPEYHSGIYQAIQKFIWEPDSKPFSGVISHVIIKGTYDAHWVILNVVDVDGQINSLMNKLSKYLTKKFKSIQGVSLVVEDRSHYYLSDQAHKSFRKIFGAGEITQFVGDRKFLYHPLSFSQTNEAVLAEFVKAAGALIGTGDSLADLYCGYGLFALSFADRFKRISGIDSSEPSIRSAIPMSKKDGLAHVRFTKAPISEDTLTSAFAKLNGRLAVILDPPRQGTDAGVIEVIADRSPARILHIFCDVNLLRQECKRWANHGYHVTAAVPVDMFPATSHLEVMILLEPK